MGLVGIEFINSNIHLSHILNMIFLFVLFLFSVRASAPYLFGNEDASILPKDPKALSEIAFLKTKINEYLNIMQAKGINDEELIRLKTFLLILRDKNIAC